MVTAMMTAHESAVRTLFTVYFSCGGIRWPRLSRRDLQCWWVELRCPLQAHVLARLLPTAFDACRRPGLRDPQIFSGVLMPVWAMGQRPVRRAVSRQISRQRLSDRKLVNVP